MTAGLEGPFHHRLIRSLRKRGPDEIGFWTDGRVQMAHSRLAVIGLDERSTEPLENKTHVLVFNGEIYNFVQLRNRLVSEGKNFACANDAAALLEAWSRWGPQMLTELTGFWAFVIYDKRRGKLVLVRDQFGIKPLYYRHQGTKICVASLLRTILEAGDFAPGLDYEALSEYVRYQFTFGDKTFLQGIRKVLPGHWIEIDVVSGQEQVHCYENIFSDADNGRVSLTAEWIEETRELLRSCVNESTISDTSFTTFCSGGMDSSLITRIAQPEIAYHANYSDPDCNETFYAKQVVEGTTTRLFVVNAKERFNLIERLQDIVEDFDEPTIGSVILPMDDLLDQVKRRYKVILTGTGGDELFAGYVRYQLALGECFQDSYRALYERVKKINSVAERFEICHLKGDPSFYRFYEAGVEQTFREAFHSCRNSGDDLEGMMRFDRRYFLAGLLNIDDKMCGRHSLESRPSLLHQQFVRQVARLDPRAFLANGTIKPVLRQIASGILPKAILHRTDKMGFTTPIGNFINQNSHLIREHLEGSHFHELYDLKRMNFTAETKYSREVFGLLILDLWLNRYARAHEEYASVAASA